MPQLNAKVPKGIEVVHIGPGDELAAYDELPPRIRRLVADGPAQVSAYHVLQHYRQAGEQAVIAAIWNSYVVYLQACAAETGVPLCPWQPTSSSSRIIGTGKRISARLLPARLRRNLLPSDPTTRRDDA